MAGEVAGAALPVNQRQVVGSLALQTHRGGRLAGVGRAHSVGNEDVLVAGGRQGQQRELVERTSLMTAVGAQLFRPAWAAGAAHQLPVELIESHMTNVGARIDHAELGASQ